VRALSCLAQIGDLLKLRQEIGMELSQVANDPHIRERYEQPTLPLLIETAR